MIITSLTNSHIKGLNKLKEKKYRDDTGKFLVEGEHLVKEANKEGLLEEIIVTENFSSPYQNVKVTVVSPDVMKKLSDMDSYPEVIGVCHKMKEKKIGWHVLVLDDIQDPGNLGTIIRSAVAFNIDTIILSKKTVDLYNPKVVRSTQGMLFHINIITSELVNLISELKKDDYKIMGTKVIGGSDVRKVVMPSKYALIIGNEGHGMSNELSTLCDYYLYVKMNDNVESLNAAVATSILLYEMDSKNNEERK